MQWQRSWYKKLAVLLILENADMKRMIEIIEETCYALEMRYQKIPEAFSVPAMLHKELRK